MAGTYTYTFLAKDLMSSKLAKIGAKGKSTFVSVNQQVENMTVNIHKADRASKRLTSTWSGLGSLAARLGVAFSLGSTISSVAKLGVEMEQTRISFETMLGSEARANSLINDLNKFSKSTPFSQREILNAGRNLTAYGIAQDKVLSTMTILGNAASGLNIPFGELSQIYGKIKTQNTVYNEDLNQLTGRGIPIFQELAKVMGKSPAQIKKLASEGKITFPIIEAAFQSMSAEGGRFFNLMQKQSETTGGRWESFMDRVRLGATDLGTRALPILNKLIDWGHGLLDILPQISIALGVAGSVWLAYTAGLKISLLWTKLMTIGQWSLNAAFAANPVGFVIIGIMALAAAFTYAYNQIGWFRGLVNASWESLKGMAIGIKDYVLTRIQELMSGFSSLGQALMHFFNGEWKLAWETGKKAADALNPFTGKAKDNFVKNAQDTAIASARAFGKGMAQAEKNKKKGFLASMLEGTGLEKLINPSSPSSTSDGATGDGGGTGLGDTVTNGINAINGGGSRQTNITVTFDKLVENFTISSQNIAQGMAQSEEELKRMLLRVLNSANQMQTSPV